MTPAEANKAILQRWMALWHTLAGGSQSAPTVPYAFDNRKPQGGTAGTFAIVEITSLGADQVTMGQRRYEHTGFIDVKLYGPRDQGRGQLDTIAEYVRRIYEMTRLGATDSERGVVTYAMTINELRGDPEFPELWCLLCRTPFYFHRRG